MAAKLTPNGVEEKTCSAIVPGDGHGAGARADRARLSRARYKWRRLVSRLRITRATVPGTGKAKADQILPSGAAARFSALGLDGVLLADSIDIGCEKSREIKDVLFGPILELPNGVLPFGREERIEQRDRLIRQGQN